MIYGGRSVADRRILLIPAEAGFVWLVSLVKPLGPCLRRDDGAKRLSGDIHSPPGMHAVVKSPSFPRRRESSGFRRVLRLRLWRQRGKP